MIGTADEMISRTAVPCIGCRRCEKVCPQTIKISEELKRFASKMGRD